VEERGSRSNLRHTTGANRDRVHRYSAPGMPRYEIDLTGGCMSKQ
jgi:hypothetical protein